MHKLPAHTHTELAQVTASKAQISEFVCNERRKSESGREREGGVCGN